MRRRCLVLAGALSVAPAAAWAQGDPLGPEFRVNTYTTDFQVSNAVTVDPSGNFVVAWSGSEPDGTSGIFAQRFTGGGAPAGPEFRVNTYTTGHQYVPAIGSDASGNFVVVWNSDGQDGSATGVFGQRFAASGAPLGPEFRVNTHTTLSQRVGTMSLGVAAGGDFVVAWESRDQDGSDYGVFGQRYSVSGVPAGPEFRVNTYADLAQAFPSAASDPSAGFVVVWQGYGQDGSSAGVFGQRFAGSGNPLGPEFRINTYTTDRQAETSVSSDAAGNFVVVWASYGQDGSERGVFGQRYASSGVPLGPEFRVNTYTTGYQSIADVAMDASGNFVVTWVSDAQDGSTEGAFAQRYASTGAPIGPEFRANTYTPGGQSHPNVATDPAGHFVVAWDSELQDGSDYGVYGQRYSAIVPVELMHLGIE